MFLYCLDYSGDRTYLIFASIKSSKDLRRVERSHATIFGQSSPRLIVFVLSLADLSYSQPEQKSEFIENVSSLHSHQPLQMVSRYAPWRLRVNTLTFKQVLFRDCNDFTSIRNAQ